MRILSLDAGFGDTKTAVMDDGVITKAKEMDSVVELSTAESFSDLKIINDSIFEFNGKKYLVGGNALQTVSRYAKSLDVKDYETFKYVTPLLLQKYMRKYKGDFDRFVLSISYAYYERSGDYKKFVSDNTGIPMDKLSVLPQGAAGKLAIDEYGLNLNNPSMKGKYLNYLLIDGGFNSLDTSLVIDGKLLPVNIHGYPGKGVIQVAEKLIPHIKELSGETISYSKARQIIATRRYVHRGKPYEVNTFIDRCINSYIVDIGNFLEEEFGDQMNSIDNIIIFGGLGEIVRSKMDIWKTMFSPNFVQIPVDSAEYYNVVGALYFTPKVVH